MGSGGDEITERRGLLLDLSQIPWDALGRLSCDSLNETAEGESMQGKQRTEIANPLIKGYAGVIWKLIMCNYV